MPLQTGNGLQNTVVAFHWWISGFPGPLSEGAIELHNIDHCRAARITLGTTQTGPDLAALKDITIKAHGGPVNDLFRCEMRIFTTCGAGTGTGTAFHAVFNLLLCKLRRFCY